jgi:4-hydroxy-2-oxoheptanedioate aldolase
VCEMHSPEAGEIAISCARFKFVQPTVPVMPIEGSRGSGSQAFAKHIWGLSDQDYLTLADPWPLNPKGEISMGFKLENRHAVANAEEIMAIKGLAFAEPGPSDNGWSILGWDAVRPMSKEDRAKVMASPIYTDALERVRLAAKKNGVQWLGTGSHGSTMEQSYDQGMRMLPGDNEDVVHKSREYSKRKMPA